MTSNIGSRGETPNFLGLDYEFNFEFVKFYVSVDTSFFVLLEERNHAEF